VKEAKKRGLPNNKTLPEAVRAWNDESTRAVFVKYGVFTETEIESRYHIRLEQYVKAVDIEAKTLLMMIKTMVMPACMRYQSELADAFGSLMEVAKAAKVSATAKAAQADRLAELVEDVATLLAKTTALDDAITKLHKGGTLESHADFCAKTLLPTMNAVREVADKLEGEIDRDLYPMPTYMELLFQH
jgi:glutamine synthetase